MIRAVIFDLDGVLVRTDGLHYLAWKQIADAEGIDFNETINHRLRGVSRMESLEIILERAARTYSPSEKQEMADRKNAAYRDLLRTLSPADVLPGVQSLLDTLRNRGIGLAVASSSRNARAILGACGLSAAFDATVDGTEISRSKPDPEVFVIAASRMSISPADCLVVEDAPAGIEAARRAGMHVLGIGTAESLPGVQPLVRGLADPEVERLILGS